jgi:hypothetical protein
MSDDKTCGKPVGSAKNGQDRGLCTRKQGHSGNNHGNGTCSRCGEILTAENAYYRNRATLSGFLARCKACDYQSRRCKHGKWSYACRACGGRGLCEHDKHKTRCLLCNPFGVYKKYARNAKAARRPFEITFEWFCLIISQPCLYCGANDRLNASVDQYVPGAGYTTANCVPCCSPCNYMKSDWSADEFVQHALRVSAHYQKRMHVGGPADVNDVAEAVAIGR